MLKSFDDYFLSLSLLSYHNCHILTSSRHYSYLSILLRRNYDLAYGFPSESSENLIKMKYFSHHELLFSNFKSFSVKFSRDFVIFLAGDCKMDAIRSLNNQKCLINIRFLRTENHLSTVKMYNSPSTVRSTIATNWKEPKICS